MNTLTENYVAWCFGYVLPMPAPGDHQVQAQKVQWENSFNDNMRTDFFYQNVLESFSIYD